MDTTSFVDEDNKRVYAIVKWLTSGNDLLLQTTF